MANAAKKVRVAFVECQEPLTIHKLRGLLPDLRANEISMALAYLKNQRYLTREQINNPHDKGRKFVWIYRYHAERVAKDAHATP